MFHFRIAIYMYVFSSIYRFFQYIVTALDIAVQHQPMEASTYTNNDSGDKEKTHFVSGWCAQSLVLESTTGANVNRNVLALSASLLGIEITWKIENHLLNDDHLICTYKNRATSEATLTFNFLFYS